MTKTYLVIMLITLTLRNPSLRERGSPSNSKSESVCCVRRPFPCSDQFTSMFPCRPRKHEVAGEGLWKNALPPQLAGRGVSLDPYSHQPWEQNRVEGMTGK